MAKRGGFPGGGIPGKMNNLMKQAQRKTRKHWKRKSLRQQQAAVW